MSLDTDIVERYGLDLFDVPLDRTAVTVAGMIGLDVIWWVVLYDGYVPMPGMAWLMDQGIPMAAPGAVERGVSSIGTFDAVVGYVVMWGVMMWAMMYPAMTRFTREYAAAHEGSALDAMKAVTAFLLGYHVVWALSAVIPLAYEAALPGGIYGFTRANTHLVIGGVLVLAGLYQASSFKRSRLRTCCARVEPHRSAVASALEDGLVHGGNCVLVCFGLFFLVMPFFGEMNFFWMIALTAIVTAERLPTWGREFAIASGVVALLAGLIVLVFQPALPVSFAISM